MGDAEPAENYHQNQPRTSPAQSQNYTKNQPRASPGPAPEPSLNQPPPFPLTMVLGLTFVFRTLGLGAELHSLARSSFSPNGASDNAECSSIPQGFPLVKF